MCILSAPPDELLPVTRVSPRAYAPALGVFSGRNILSIVFSEYSYSEYLYLLGLYLLVLLLLSLLILSIPFFLLYSKEIY